MKYRIYAGGNKRNLPWENDRNSGNTHHTVRYAAHLKDRAKDIEFHLDFCHEAMQNWVKTIAADKKLPAATELGTHLLGAGSFVSKLVVQVKQGAVGTGTIGVIGREAVAPIAPTAPFDSIDAATDATAVATGTAGSEAVVFAPVAFDMAVPGWYVFDVNKMLQDEGEVVVQFDQAMAAGCLSFYVSVTDYASEHECECCHPPCDTVFPPPLKC